MGEHHVNEQWQTLVGRAVSHVGYIAVDCMRRRVWDNPEVEWWYAQNMLLMVRNDHLAASPAAAAARDTSPGPYASCIRAPISTVWPPPNSGVRGAVEWLALGPEIVSTTLRRWLVRADKL